GRDGDSASADEAGIACELVSVAVQVDERVDTIRIPLRELVHGLAGRVVDGLAGSERSRMLSARRARHRDDLGPKLGCQLAYDRADATAAPTSRMTWPLCGSAASMAAR